MLETKRSDGGAQSAEAGAGAPAVGFPEGPRIRRITAADVTGALAEGLADFRAAPLYGVAFAALFVLGGWFAWACLAHWDAAWAVIPLSVAFPLAGPFLAVGLYEISRRRAGGEAISRAGVLAMVVRQKDRQLAWMAFVTLFIFWMWAYQARLLIAIFFGVSADFSTIEGFLAATVADANGWSFLAVGTAVGAVIAGVLFAVTAIGMPLIVDRDVDIVTAIATSVAAARRNLAPMALWAAIIAGVTLLALAPAFIGLLIAFPVLGHATWRLYARVIER